jgi:hypothetical protein
MLQVLGQRLPQVVLTDDQHLVEELTAQGAGDSLADAAQRGFSARAHQLWHELATKHSVRAGWAS